MTQRELNAAVARSTGENLYAIRSLGFTLEEAPPKPRLTQVDENPPPYIPSFLDWDAEIE